MSNDKETVGTVTDPRELPKLLPLTPEYQASSHQVYLNAIEKSLANSRNRSGWNVPYRVKRWWELKTSAEPGPVLNIALTGGYGAGKSSVLQKVAKNHPKKVVEVSLSTLGLFKKNSVGHSSEPKSEPEQNPVTDSSQSAVETKTNAIQKEIVKQLLYREEPVKLPGSRFRRIGRFKKLRALGVSVLLGVIAAVVFFLSGWSEDLSKAVDGVDLGYVVHLIIFGFVGISTYGLIASMHHRVHIRQVKVADADISLDQGANSYFDQYLDEIVYFFDVTKRDIVIFEDLDRFDHAPIFETLRSLNTLLNGAGQLKGRRIRFIYALKDSIFVEIGKLGNEDAPERTKEDDLVAVEVERANRTKFFDLVIPMVPFITHRNARNLIDEVFEGVSQKIDPELIDLAATHITDMRLIKNIRNEFVVFKDRVFTSDDGDELALNDNSLFAMMLYKSTHLSDFEKIKNGTSNLDGLYKEYSAIIAKALDETNTKIRQAREQLSHIATVSSRSRELGDALISYAEPIARHIGVQKTPTVQVAFEGEVLADETLHRSDFWRSFAEGTGPLEISFVVGGAPRGQISISKQDAIMEFGNDLASEVHWDAKNRTLVEEQLGSLLQTRSELLYSEMTFLLEHEVYTNESGATFRTLTETLESRLAQQLVAGGYIDKDFILYTSSYYSSRVSTNAQNFILRHINRNVMGVAYPLAPADVQAILDEQGDSALRESGMYNVNVLDYLLGVQMEDESDEDYIERERRASVLVRALVRNGDREQIFIDAYFSLGSELHAFVQALAASWPGVFSLIVSRSELGHENRLALFNSALEAMAEGRDYQERIKIERLFIEEHFAQLPVLTSSSDSELADRIATAFGNGSVKLSTLEPLSAEIRRAITSVNGYKVTRENLRLALESQDLSLDQIKEADRTVYQYVLSELESYLVAAREGDTGALIVAESGSLAMIVSDVFAANADLLPEVLEGAVQGSTIGQISGVPAGSWPVLADFRVFPATASNVTAYIASAGEIDAHLGALLANSRKILHPEDIEQIERVALAEQILAANGNIPDAATRVALVVSLRLESFLSPSSVPAEDGPLLGLLIAQKVIDDDEDSFALALTQDWKTRELAISKSKKFETFVTTRELPLEDIARLTSSDLILDSLKALIIERVDEFVPTDNRVALTALASHALKQNIELPVPLVSRMAVAGVSHEIVVPLLEPILDRLDQSQLSSILTSLGGNYAIAAVRNGKRPKLRKTESNLALASRLEALEIAKSHSIEADHIRINMRR